MSSKRRLTGWPPQPGRPASGSELARARQTGTTVEQLRHEQTRCDAADVLQSLLDVDKEAQSRDYEGFSDRQRWALHVAVAVLKGGRS